MELLLELVFQLVVEVVSEIGWETKTNLLSSRTGRLVFSGVVGGVGGAIWGAVVTTPTLPRTVWVSLLLAIVGAVFSVVTPTDKKAGFLPWHWSQHQWEGFAVLNAFAALGVYLGWVV